MLLNTEHRKVEHSSGELEMDGREITEESLFELLPNSSLKEVLSFAKVTGIETKWSKTGHNTSGKECNFQR